jgi:hypothetical protein
VAEPTFVPAFVRDARVTLCEVQEKVGTLTGVADRSLREPLAAHAEAQGLRLEVAFPEPKLGQVVCGRTPLYVRASSDSTTLSEVGFGETVRAYDRQDGFVRVATQHDSYYGWLPAEVLGTLPEPTHRFGRLRGHVYAEPEVSAMRLMPLAYGAPLAALREKEGWMEIVLEEGTGYVQARSLSALDARLESTPEALTGFALRFLEAPYVWGGVSAWGLDCSGLVQTVYRAHGFSLPRDADQQAEIGQDIALSDLRAADLLFFPGHVALALDGDSFVHANAHHMCVSIDSLSDGGYGQGLREAITAIKRVLP